VIVGSVQCECALSMHSKLTEHVILYSVPSNLLRGFQSFGFENRFGAKVFSDLGYGIGLLRVGRSPGVHPNPPFGPILDSTADLKPFGRAPVCLRDRDGGHGRLEPIGSAGNVFVLSVC